MARAFWPCTADYREGGPALQGRGGEVPKCNRLLRACRTPAPASTRGLLRLLEAGWKGVSVSVTTTQQEALCLFGSGQAKNHCCEDHDGDECKVEDKNQKFKAST